MLREKIRKEVGELDQNRVRFFYPVLLRSWCDLAVSNGSYGGL